MEEDRRCAIRWQIALPVRYRGLGKHKEGSCHTQDISTMGARLAMVEKCHPGDRLNMVLDVSGSDSGPVCVEADIVWQKEAGELNEECNYMAGVIFRKIRDCHKNDILDYVSTNFPEIYKRKWWEGIK